MREESQTRRSGSEWIGSDAVLTAPGKEIKSSRQRQYEQTGQPSGRSRMPGRFCGKVIGFRGSHKKGCPLSKSLNLRINSSSNRNSFSECIKKSGRLPSTREFLSPLETAIEVARTKRGRFRLFVCNGCSLSSLPVAGVQSVPLRAVGVAREDDIGLGIRVGRGPPLRLGLRRELRADHSRAVRLDDTASIVARPKSHRKAAAARHRR